MALEGSKPDVHSNPDILHGTSLESYGNTGNSRDAANENIGDWLAVESAPNEARENIDTDISENLYTTILRILPAWRKLYPRQTVAAKDVAAQLYLWGRDYTDGLLSLILSQADELRCMVLELLHHIGRLLWKDLSYRELEHGGSLVVETSYLVEKLKSTLDQAFRTLGSWRDYGVNGPRLDSNLPIPVPRFDEYQAGGAAVEDCLGTMSGSWPPAPVLDEHDQDSLASTQEEDNNLELLLDLVAELLELAPALEQTCSHLHFPNSGKPREHAFSVSVSALPLVQNIADRFKEAERDLVERLGEANWQRFQALRTQTEPSFEGEEPRSVFGPQTLFHDSGLGPSIGSQTLKTASIASHTSFASSLGEFDPGTPRVPKTPDAVQRGKSFVCEICKRIVSGIETRVQWKIHVFEDLRPYICTFGKCGSQLTTFATREEWSNHEFGEHRDVRVWSCPDCSQTSTDANVAEDHILSHHSDEMSHSRVKSVARAGSSIQAACIEDQVCPLCLQTPGRSKRNFVKHLARHLENIALAALPQDNDDDSDVDSNLSSSGKGSKAAMRPTSSKGSLAALTMGSDELSGASVASSIGARNIGQRLLEDGVNVPAQGDPIYECPFDRLSCRLTFANFSQWYKHSLTHFKGIDPPADNSCCFCEAKFKHEQGQKSWRQRMEHIELHHRNGHRLRSSRCDVELYRYLWKHQIISDSDFKELTRENYMSPRTPPPSASPSFTVKEPRRPQHSWR